MGVLYTVYRLPSQPPDVNILVVSSYPPTRCGIARYAFQQVQHLTAQGHTVRVMSIDGRGDTNYVLDLSTPTTAARSLATMARFERVVVHFAPGLLPPDPESRKTFYRSLRDAARSNKSVPVEIVVHESDYPGGWRAKRYLSALWKSADRLIFHTTIERDRFARCFRSVPSSRLKLATHESEFSKFYTGTAEEARRALDIPEGHTVFVSCGFFYEGKGVDRAIRVFERSQALLGDARYYVVGTARVPEHEAYGEALKAAAAPLANVSVIDDFVDDETFDKWIVAADCILLPYRSIWSSGVMARAALYARPVIATDVGGLRDQAGPNDVVVTDDRELADAIVAFGSGTVLAPRDK